MRLPVAILMLVVLAVRPALALPAGTAAGNPTIVVAIIATLSGPDAMAGQDTVDGFTTGLREMGGRFANQEVRVQVVDDHGSPDTAVQVTRRLLERDKVDFVLTAVSQAAMAAIIKPLLDAHIFVINLDAAPAALAGAECSPWLFQMGTPPDAIGEAAGAYFAGEKFGRVVVVGPDAPATGAAVAAIRRTWTGEIAAVLRPRHGAVLYAPQIKRLHQLAPDAVYSVLTGGMGLAFVRDYVASGLKSDLPLIGQWTGFERPYLTAMADQGLDLLNIAPWSPDLDTPLNKRMVADFELEYGRPATSWVAHGFDAAQLLESAMKSTSGRTSDRDAVRRGLRRADFASVRGGFRFDTNHMPSVNIYLRRVAHDGKGRLSDEMRGVLLKDWHSREIAQCPMRWVDEPVVIPPKPGVPVASPKPAAAKPPVKTPR